LTIILDIEPSKSLKRKKELEDKFENIEFLNKVREIYLNHSKRWGYKIINSDRPMDKVQNEIRKIVKKRLEK
ncbi:MAG: thymidylate kinase, partial [Promethearchaeota archaeon]